MSTPDESVAKVLPLTVAQPPMRPSEPVTLTEPPAGRVTFNVLPKERVMAPRVRLVFVPVAVMSAEPWFRVVEAKVWLEPEAAPATTSAPPLKTKPEPAEIRSAAFAPAPKSSLSVPALTCVEPA